MINLIYKFLRTRMEKKWKRTLPFTELIVDRWEKGKHLGFGDNTSIFDSAIIYDKDKITVGDDSWIGQNTVLDGSGGLEIGYKCTISAGVHIYTHDSVRWTLYDEPYKYAPVKIGDRCYIGPYSVITKGVTIGDNCVIGAFSFVNKDIPSNSVAFGQPARVRKKI